MEGFNPNFETPAWDDMSVQELRQECEKRGLDTTGKRQALVTRLEMLSMTAVTDEQIDAARGVETIQQEPAVNYPGNNGGGYDENLVEMKEEGNTGPSQEENDKTSPFYKYFPTEGDKNFPLVRPHPKDKVSSDIKVNQKNCIVNVYPIALTDLSRPEVLEELDKCSSVSMNFYRDPTDNWTGRLTFTYKQADDAKSGKNVLKLSESLQVKGELTPAEGVLASKAINKAVTEVVQIECVLFVAPIPFATTPQEMRAVFPEAKDILLFKDESKGHKRGADAYKDPPGYAYLVYPDKKAAREAAVKHYDPIVPYRFHGDTAFVVPAIENEEDPLFNVIRKMRRKFYIRSFIQARNGLSECQGNDFAKKKADQKHCRFYYNKLALDEESRKKLNLPLLEPSVRELVPDINREIWKDAPVESSTVGGSGHNRGGGRGGFNNFQGNRGGFQVGRGGFQGNRGGFQDSRGGFQGNRGGFQDTRGGFRGAPVQQTQSGYKYQPRGRSGYAVGQSGALEKPEPNVTMSVGMGRGVGQGPGMVGRGGGAGGGPIGRGMGQGFRGRGGGMMGQQMGQQTGQMGMNQNFGNQGFEDFGNQQVGYNEGFTGAPAMPQGGKSKKDKLLDKLSTLLSGLDDDEDEGQMPGYPGGFQQGGNQGFRPSMQPGYKRPMGPTQDMGASLQYKRPRPPHDGGGYY